MNLAYAVRQILGGNDGADAPAGYAVGLGKAVDGDGALAHPREAGNGDVTAAVVQDVLIDFVGDGEHVVAAAEGRDGFQFLSVEYFAGGIVGSVDDDGA